MSKLLITNALPMLNFFSKFRQNPRDMQGFRRKSCYELGNLPRWSCCFLLFRDVELKWCPASGLRFYAEPACARQQ